MNLQEKIKLIQKDKDLFITLKRGKLIEVKNIYYQTPKWFANIFYFYYYSGLAFLLYLMIFYFMVSILKNIYISFLIGLLIIFCIEFVFFVLTPMKEVRHWKAY